ncbi:MAG: hypothetical protein A2653_03080 [Candidatus Zambryskibacteria bacterium RIFCSPHIGHO2_01_FULL_43_25]|uniref:Uncharacterized protein n=1 Tax=Candidatus Zambryskibacteria bacterium RIFCSPLOWO2_01_FULL_45_21 TaxID=1802761 RepID=A0A1G2U2P3_9BACT|nr:MAG: hypothetical protein A2653_03080 [Candidatus Zambryskibacteria bacterium RIFCSPHIGHO2_01_FULL_43_25]OHB00991.1 MAG: hypothetical protein A3E94_02265 [Candidatus Zambryskibacteria bacterium RIFCSPHIGHO2_12_FULL_44_12b]OHB03709.1 MAG: hypothetical protein A3B14_01540 [Candidatus Zambryskibacteria bacterium RIFCSPLOWO2_01_FULL_45_21]
METYEFIFRVIETALQLVLVIFAGLALSVWKREVRGKDKYKLARELLTYIKELRFLIHSKNGSFHQIYLNDILVNRENFYNDQLILIGKDELYFDYSIWGLFNHINVRADIFLPKQIRSLLEELYPSSGKRIGTDKNQYTYIQLAGIEPTQVKSIEDEKDSTNGIYQIHNKKHLTIGGYFRKWESLIVELQKIA